MLELGKTKTDFEERKEEICILNIQKEMLEGDYFVKESDGWKEVHTGGIYEVTGNETITKIASTTLPAYYFPNIANADIYVSFSTIPNLLSNCFKTVAYNTLLTETTGCYISNRNNSETNTFVLADSNYSTVEDFKLKLQELYDAGTPVKVYYKLATPTKLACTQEQSAVLEELSNLDLFEGTNNIITVEDIALLKLKYALDVETYVDNKIDEKLANINAQILEIAGGN